MTLFDLAIGNSGNSRGYIDLIFEVQPDMVPRYRDHWLEIDGDDAIVLAIYTRMGGGNREDYAEQIDAMRATRFYLSDDDDTFDSTYATFRFRITHDQYIEMTTTRRALREGVDPEYAWGQFRSHAEPIPRNMAVIWEAMLSTLPGNFNNE